MSNKLSTLTRNIVGDTIALAIDSGSVGENGFIEVRTGPKPANPQTGATGSILAIFDFPSPALPDYVNGTSVTTLIPDATILAEGEPGWFRIYDRDGFAILDGDVSNEEGDGEMKFINTDWVAGGTASLSSLRLTIKE